MNGSAPLITPSAASDGMSILRLHWFATAAARDKLLASLADLTGLSLSQQELLLLSFQRSGHGASGVAASLCSKAISPASFKTQYAGI